MWKHTHIALQSLSVEDVFHDGEIRIPHYLYVINLRHDLQLSESNLFGKQIRTSYA